MAESSVASALSFLNYKIDIFKFKMEPKVLLIVEPEKLIDTKDVLYSYSLRNTTYLKKSNAYISGFNLSLKLFNFDTPVPDREKEETEALIEVETGIVGFFTVDTKGRLSKDEEIRLVQVNGSAILFPYLRAAISLHFSSCGFPTFIFPILNINNLAMNSAQQVNIDEIDI